MSSRGGLILIALTLVAAIALGIFELRRPGWSEPIPGLAILLGVVLLIDLVLQQLAAQGRLDPLTMPYRAAAFIFGGIVMTALPALLR